jgi:hypothetical protein
MLPEPMTPILIRVIFASGAISPARPPAEALNFVDVDYCFGNREVSADCQHSGRNIGKRAKVLNKLLARPRADLARRDDVDANWSQFDRSGSRKRLDAACTSTYSR